MILNAIGIQKSYGNHHVLHGVNLSVGESETLSILGRSGCGKTTLLKIIAGLVDPDGGDVYVKGVCVNDRPIAKRNVVYIYQEPLLFPHLTVFENVAFGLRARKTEARHIEQETRIMLERLELAAHAGKMPNQLSGGQRQRVAFGRAIIVNPDVLLLDEPFSNLDAGTRTNMQRLFRELATAYGIASVFVTHDLKEAIIIGDALSYMEDGMLVNFATKEEFIRHPQYGAQSEIAFWKALDDIQVSNDV